jgi:hypothetical protein
MRAIEAHGPRRRGPEQLKQGRGEPEVAAAERAWGICLVVLRDGR